MIVKVMLQTRESGTQVSSSSPDFLDQTAGYYQAACR